MKKKIWNEESLNILYECWKNNESIKEQLLEAANKLPKISQPEILSMMRKMAKTDTKWLKWATRIKTQKEKEIEKEKQAIAAKKELIIKKRQERENKRKIKEKVLLHKNVIEELKSKLDQSFSKSISELIKPEFFFCPDVSQYVNNNSCIFRVFSNCIPVDSQCAECKRMDKHIDLIREAINGRQKRSV